MSTRIILNLPQRFMSKHRIRNVAGRIVFQPTDFCTAHTWMGCLFWWTWQLPCYLRCEHEDQDTVPPPFISICNNTAQGAADLRDGQSNPFDIQRLLWLVTFPTHLWQSLALALSLSLCLSLEKHKRAQHSDNKPLLNGNGNGVSLVDDPGFESQQRQIFLFWGPPTILFNWYLDPFLGLKRLGRAGNRSPPYSAEAREEEGYTSASHPYAFMTWMGETFTFTGKRVAEIVWYD